MDPERLRSNSQPPCSYRLPAQPMFSDAPMMSELIEKKRHGLGSRRVIVQCRCHVRQLREDVLSHGRTQCRHAVLMLRMLTHLLPMNRIPEIVKVPEPFARSDNGPLAGIEPDAAACGTAIEKELQRPFTTGARQKAMPGGTHARYRIEGLSRRGQISRRHFRWLQLQLDGLVRQPDPVAAAASGRPQHMGNIGHRTTERDGFEGLGLAFRTGGHCESLRRPVPTVKPGLQPGLQAVAGLIIVGTVAQASAPARASPLSERSALPNEQS